MKGMILDIDGVVNLGALNEQRRDTAARRALRDANIAVTNEAFNETRQIARLARASETYPTVLWSFFRVEARERGWDTGARDKRWRELLANFRGDAGYHFEARPGARELLEELKFNVVDNWGDAPRLLGVAQGGAMTRDALEQARLLPLFDELWLTEEREMSAHDARFLLELIAQYGLAPEQCALAGECTNRFLSPAKELGMFTLHVLGQGEQGGTSRGPWEEPDLVVTDNATLGDALTEWVNIPAALVRSPRRA